MTFIPDKNFQQIRNTRELLDHDKWHPKRAKLTSYLMVTLNTFLLISGAR
jgi:hypothetical protein